MNYNQVFILVFVSKAFVYVLTEICPFKIDECEYCDVDNYNFTTLMCNKAGGLIEKIDFDIHLINNYYSYRKISIEILNKNIKTLPSLLFKSLKIETLTLAINQIETISPDSFSVIKSINKLDLSLNNLKSIDNLMLSFQSNIYMDRQDQLKILILDFNRIDSIKLPFLSSFSQLNSLSLSSNQIEKLYYGTFNNLVSLEKLSLRKNKLSYIDGFIFSSLTNLTELILTENQLSYINRILFKGLVNLNYLSVDSNLILMIETDSFIDLNNLKYLYLDNNKLKHLESLAFSGLTKLDTLSLSYNYLEVINQNMFSMLANLKVLNLDSNIINRIDRDAFVYLKNLSLLSLNNNFLDSSNNFIEYLVNLEEFNMNNNRIKKFFHFSRNLKKISFRSNYITSITTGLDGFLTHLDLSSNKLSKLKNQDFENFQNLKELLLNENKIASIERDTFKNLINLEILNLSENNILELKNHTLIFLSKLSFLNLNNNSISSIYKETFSGLSKLEVLGLNDNYLSSLNDFVFDELISIKSIYLIENEIEFISSSIFSCSQKAISSIKQIFLSYNMIKNLKFLISSCLKNLENIDISYNLIERIDRDDFMFLKNLQRIVLSFNKIFFIEKYAFKYSNIQTLTLSNISSSVSIIFNVDFIEDMPISLKYLDLSYNKIEFTNTNVTFNYSNVFQKLYLLNLVDCYIDDVNKIPFKLFPNLESLFLKNAFINTSRNESLFSSLKNLHFLDLEHAQLNSISLIDSNIIANLIGIDLSYNNIQKIEVNDFKYSYSMDVINLSHNSIEIIEKGTFNDIYFTSIDLSFNKLKYLREDEFYNSNPRFFYINNNLISNLSRLSRNYFELIEEFRFSFNSLESFDECEIYFSKKNSLNFLYLDHNRISKINKNSLSLFKYLRDLYLNSNQIANIEADSFNNLDHLEILRLDDNKIETLNDSLFQYLFKLKFLNLSSNSLKLVKTSLFSKLFNLIELDLSNNDLLLIEAHSMLSMEKLKNLYLNENKNLAIVRHCFFGLKSIENIFISFEVLLNRTSRLNLVNSINLTISTVIMDRTYYKSINLIATFCSENIKNENNECGIILYFLKLNYFLNLKTDFDVAEFFRKCPTIVKDTEI